MLRSIYLPFFGSTAKSKSKGPVKTSSGVATSTEQQVNSLIEKSNCLIGYIPGGPLDPKKLEKNVITNIVRDGLLENSSPEILKSKADVERYIAQQGARNALIFCSSLTPEALKKVPDAELPAKFKVLSRNDFLVPANPVSYTISGPRQ